MGNPIVKALAGIAQVDRMAEHYDTPILKILDGYVANFHYENTNPPHYRRFIVLRIQNDSDKAATGCWATITVPELQLKEIPLHWVDCEYTVLRNSMKSITIPPHITRELDVAFSVYGKYLPGEYQLVLGTGTNAIITKSYEPTRGTIDPNLMPTGSRFVEFDSDIEDDKVIRDKLEPMRFGSWIASHLVLANPKEDTEYHLAGNEPPKRYNSTIRVTCNEGHSVEAPMVLLVTPNPEGLDYDWRVTPRSQ